MKIPRFSVIIPAYNEVDFIYNCVKSVLKQDFPKDNFEVIVVDNNSSDKTQEIVKNNFPEVIVIEEKRQGVNFARITGINSSRGKYIVFIDADCCAPVNWLKNIAVSFDDQEIVAVGGPILFTPKNLWISFCEKINNTSFSYFKRLWGANMSFKKQSYYSFGGIPEDINLNEDYYLSKQFKKIGEVICLNNNPVFSSSRRFTNPSLLPYIIMTNINVLLLYFIGRTLFKKFTAVRNSKKN